MSRAKTLLRVVALSCLLLISLLSCQSFYGKFTVDDSAFAAQTGPIFLSPVKGLFTTEWGGKATFTIVCDHQPTEPVTVALSSSNTNEGTVSPSSVTFNQDDWKAPQVITVTGVDDTQPDRNHTYKIITDPAVSADPSYNRKNPIDLELVNVDNETAGITVVPKSGLVTSEAGGQDIFSVVLNSKPGSDVTIKLVSDRPTEGTVSPESLVFTSANWMAPQLVTVTGVDDSEKDGARPYKINLTTTSEDQNYAHVVLVSVDVKNLDNETAGVTVALLSGVDPIDKTKLRTSESGDSATFSVVLNAPPSTDVVIPVASDTLSEGKVSTDSLTFTKLNWSAPQVVTVTGVDDDETADGDQPYLIVLGTPTGEDADYTKLESTTVPVVNTDNEKPGFTLMLLSGTDPQNPGKLLTSENGTTATFSLALNSRPKSPVIVRLYSGMPLEASVIPEQLTFTSDNWNAPQIVSVKGLEDDGVQDGSPLFYVTTLAATSDDPGYDTLDPADVQVTNQDNDSANVNVVMGKGFDAATNRLITDETGTTATFTIALASRPTDDVTITLGSSNQNEGQLWFSSFVFTPENYASPQLVTIQGIDDDQVADGNQPYVINVGAAVSNDGNYNGKFSSQVQMLNRDNDSADVIVSPQSGLITSEGGKADSFTIRLQSKPTADVTIGVSSSNPAEGKPNVSSVTFTPLNWNANQTISVVGQNDDVQDGNQPYKINLTPASNSLDLTYRNIDPPDVSLTNNDNDSAGFYVTPTSGLVTSEGGGKATFTVVLTSKPVNTASPGKSTTVTFSLSSNKPTEGSVSPASITFTDVNWGAPQTVTVTGVQDDIADGPQTYVINMMPATSADANYNNHKASDVSVTNTDDDSALVVISPLPSSTPASTTEKSAGKSTFTVNLNSRPSNDVSFTVSSLDTSEGRVSPAMLTFTASNWKTPQTVTVTGVDDSVADGDQQYTVRLSNGSSMDPNYNNKFGTDLPFINIDDDVPAVDIVAPAVLKTKESNAGSAKFTVALRSQPKASVSIAVSSSRLSEGKVSPTTLVFTASDWSDPQTVTVTGVQDEVADGPQTYLVRLGNAMSADLDYDGRFGTQLDAENADDDQAGYTVSALSSTQTSEKGDQVTFSVVLTSKPADTTTVTLGVNSKNDKEGIASPSSLLFTGSDWDQPHQVTVTGVDDKKADGDVSYQVEFVADADYGALPPPPIVLTNTNDDTLGVLVTTTTCSTTPGTMATFTIRLNSQPTANVTIPLHSEPSTAGSVSPDFVTFTPSGTGIWDMAQTVTVTGRNDGSVGTTTPFTIITDPASAPTESTGYNGYAAIPDVSCTNTTP